MSSQEDSAKKEGESSDIPLENIPSSKILTAGEYSRIIFYDLQTSEVEKIDLSPDTIQCVNYTRYLDEKTLIMVLEGSNENGDSDYIKLYDLESKTFSPSLMGMDSHIWHVLPLKISGERFLSVSSWDNAVWLVKLSPNSASTSQPKKCIEHENYVNASEYYDTSQLLCSAGDDSHVFFYSIEKEVVVKEVYVGNPRKTSSGVFNIDLDKDELLASFSDGVSILDCRTMSVESSFLPNRSMLEWENVGPNFHVSRFSPNGNIIMNAGESCIALVDRRKMSEVMKSSVNPFNTTCWRMQVIGDHYFAVNSEDATMKVFDYECNVVRLFHANTETYGRKSNFYALSYFPDELKMGKTFKDNRLARSDELERIQFLRDEETELETKRLRILNTCDCDVLSILFC